MKRNKTIRNKSNHAKKEQGRKTIEHITKSPLKPSPNYFGHAIFIVVIAISIVWLESLKAQPQSGADYDTMMENEEGKAPELAGISGYLNAESDLTIKSLRGKVVMVDFWTYSCINCIRTLPYLNAWHEKYADDGLVIIGVHTPEFAFEKDIENVRKAMEKYGVEYPVVLDNGYATWRAYQNNHWPRKYLIDKNGYIRYDHIGEGAYDETEKKIQELLGEIGANPEDDLVAEKDTTPRTLNTPELYLGYANAIPRGQNLGGAGFQPNKTFEYGPVSTINDNIVYVEQLWANHEEYLESVEDSVMYLKFTGKTANIVLDGNGTVDVHLDGKLIPYEVRGKDITPAGLVVDSARLYELYNGPYGTHTLLLRFMPGIKVHAFTFG